MATRFWFKLFREDCDAFALRSQQTWGAAAEAGVFADEITPITLKIKKKEVEMKLDEHPKPKTTIEQLAKLPPVFKKGGVVTAGGASGIFVIDQWEIEFYWIQSTKTQVSVMEPQQWWLPVRRPSRSTTSLHWPGGWRNFFLIGHLMDCVNLLLSGLLVMAWQDASRLSWALDRFHPSRWFEIPVKWIFESTIILLSYHENHTIFLTLGHVGEDWC